MTSRLTWGQDEVFWDDRICIISKKVCRVEPKYALFNLWWTFWSIIWFKLQLFNVFTLFHNWFSYNTISVKALNIEYFDVLKKKKNSFPRNKIFLTIPTDFSNLDSSNKKLLGGRPQMTSRNYGQFLTPLPHRQSFCNKALVLSSQNLWPLHLRL